VKLKLFTPLVVLAAILVSGRLVHAESTVTQVTTNSYEDSFPRIKGDYLVWQGQVDGDWEIFVYDITTTEGPIRITDNDYGDISPQTDGNYVAWLGVNQPGGEIFVYDIFSAKTTQITEDSNVDSSPRIANGMVVWTSHQVIDSVEPGEIFLYDIVANATSSLSASVDPEGTLDDSSPRINDESVVWVQTDDAGITTLFIHDLATGVTTEAPEGFVWTDSPQIDGNLRALTRHDSSDREIFVYNSDSRMYHQITDNGLQDRYPSISGCHIAWMSGSGEIFLAGLSVMAKAATNVRQRSFTANWNPPARGADSYRLDVSTAKDFSSYVTGYQNLDVGITTSYVVTRLSLDTTYYYRVRSIGGSTSGDSNTITLRTLTLRTHVSGKVIGGILMLLLLHEDDQPDPGLR